MPVDVIIGIGHDGTDKPAQFTLAVQSVIERLGTLNARISGWSWSPEWGAEEGAWFAASFQSFDAYTEARERILAIGGSYGQDAVAFTVGAVDVAACPEPAQKPLYRDFL
jgi:hypothetical protein